MGARSGWSVCVGAVVDTLVVVIGDGEKRRRVAEGGHWETSRMVLRFKFSGVDCSRPGFGSLWVNIEKAGYRSLPTHRWFRAGVQSKERWFAFLVFGFTPGQAVMTGIV